MNLQHPTHDESNGKHRIDPPSPLNGRVPAARLEHPAFLLPEVAPELYQDFLKYWKGTNTLSEAREMLAIAREEVAYFTERLYRHPDTHLQAIGATYETVPDASPLAGFPSRVPQDQLLEAHRYRYFYGTLMTHRCLLESYRAIEAQGLHTVTGSRLSDDHPLLDEKRALTYKDYGYKIRAPRKGDGVIESTSLSFARGAAYSWTNHSFPSWYIMGSSMPDLWGDLALASAAEIGVVTFCPCDGDCGTLEAQITRYRSAKELLLRSPVWRHHPERDVLLSNDGPTVGEFIVQRGLRHLGAALKPCKDIVNRYRPLIEGEGVTTVEVYDPGATSLMEYSVKALRDAYPDLVIYAGRHPGGVEGLESVKPLRNERVTFRWGIAEGQICSTHAAAGGLAPLNFQGAALAANRAEEIQAESGHGVIVSIEAGATQRLSVTAVVGIAGCSVSNSLAGNTLEHIPPHYTYDGSNPYSGEASEVTKKKSRRVDRMGEAVDPEGESGRVKRSAKRPTCIARRAYSLMRGFVKGFRFLRTNGAVGVVAMGGNVDSYLTEFSSQARSEAEMHHQNGKH